MDGDKVNFLAVLFFSMTCINVPCQCANSTATLLPMARLYNDFIAPYNNVIRPVKNASTATKVTLRFNFLGLLDVNEICSTITINAWLEIFWNDEIRNWKPDDYDGIDYIQIGQRTVWRPTFWATNSLDQRYMFASSDSPIVITNNGSSFWYSGETMTFSCALDMTKFPFDKQDCLLSIWTLNMDDAVEFTNGGIHSSLDKINTHVPNSEWDVYDLGIDPMKRHPNGDVGKDFYSAGFRFHLRRKPSFFILNSILPVNVLALMSLLIFIIPDDSGEKITYGVTLLLATGIHLSAVSSTLPRAPENLPVVVVYLFCLYLLGGVTVVVTLATVLWRRNVISNKIGAIEDKVNSHSDWPRRKYSSFAVNATMQDASVYKQDEKTKCFKRKNDDGHEGGESISKVMDDVRSDRQRFQRSDEIGLGRHRGVKRWCARRLDIVIMMMFAALWFIITALFLYYLK